MLVQVVCPMDGAQRGYHRRRAAPLPSCWTHFRMRWQQAFSNLLVFSRSGASGPRRTHASSGDTGLMRHPITAIPPYVKRVLGHLQGARRAQCTLAAGHRHVS